ncbi:MAG: hypothetical protein EZS28_037966 [Streblomastix strix]|uniref:Uncharacterized protein n=1 Tax=Streblomastix strix TaxID=222440 RepID=A0A5J4U7E0_9EUKA|nr:MAG: hypothetical protein EZS28_037966 [Streblomastix strix]
MKQLFDDIGFPSAVIGLNEYTQFDTQRSSDTSAQSYQDGFQTSETVSQAISPDLQADKHTSDEQMRKTQIEQKKKDREEQRRKQKEEQEQKKKQEEQEKIYEIHMRIQHAIDTGAVVLMPTIIPPPFVPKLASHLTQRSYNSAQYE